VTAEIVVQDVVGPADMDDCVRLYRDVMGLRPEDGSINARLLTALRHNGGLVVGAYEGEQLVGFAYSFLARDPADGSGRLYQYSQLAVVRADRQGRGIGTQLKLAQRDRCLRQGLLVMRWAFDPMRSENGHFNLDQLGAQITDFIPQMYGANGFGRSAGESTDRFIVTWCLREVVSCSERTLRHLTPLAGDEPGTVRWAGEDLIVLVPRDWRGYVAGNPGGAAALRAALAGTFTEVLREGRVGIACTSVGDSLMGYRFSRASGAADRGRTAC